MSKNRSGYKQTELGELPEEWEDMDRFVKAVICFIKSEKFLLENELNERTIAYKLAKYLEKEYSEYDVDCEYNRMPKDFFDRDYVKKSLPIDKSNKKIVVGGSKREPVFPDIIVHKRGTNKLNFLVIELKKKANNSSKDIDFLKLKAFTLPPPGLGYKYGAYVEFDKQGVSDMKFFEGGKEYGEK